MDEIQFLFHLDPFQHAKNIIILGYHVDKITWTNGYKHISRRLNEFATTRPKSQAHTVDGISPKILKETRTN